jgi:hypothetical protein
MYRAPILVLVLGLTLVAGAYALAFAGGGALAPWALALGATLVLTAMLWLGGRRRGRLPRALAAATVLCAVATFGGFAWALIAPAPAADGPLLLGLPRVTAILLLLVGVVPGIVMPLLYAAAFDDGRDAE